MKNHVLKLWRGIQGQDLTEYALLLVVLVLAVVAVVPRFACNLYCIFEQTAVSLDKARAGIPPGQQQKCTRNCS